MYVCPHCKGPLTDFACTRCTASYPLIEGIPCLLSSGENRQRIREIYDEIYRHHTDVWVDQGRSGTFRNYFSDLVRTVAHERLLEVGCGEGALLAALPGTHRYGIDPSVHALIRARSRGDVRCSVARAEELPFPSGSFEVVVSVGVMEHFEDPAAATAEICRVLVPSGHYIALIHTDMSRVQRVRLKIREFIFPRPRPVALLAWAIKKIRHPIVQPLRKSYTIDSARACLERAGLTILRIITTRVEPSAPLAGAHVAIYVARKAPPGESEEPPVRAP
jgi:SAM-dependent methyltransferase